MVYQLPLLFKTLWRRSNLLKPYFKKPHSSRFTRLVWGFLLTVFQFISLAVVLLALVSTPTFANDWVSIGHKKALICDSKQLESCIKLLPENLQQVPSLQPKQISYALGYKSAMTLRVIDRNIAGIIVLQPEHLEEKQSVMLFGQNYPFALVNQQQLSLWHEIGHLEVFALPSHSLPNELTEYQHEWLADVYLYWRLSQHYDDNAFIWQQIHRRNMAIMNGSEHLSHWSAPQLLYLLMHYPTSRAKTYPNFAAFIDEVFPKLPDFNHKTLAELTSLINHSFTANTVQVLPNYMFWQQANLGEVIAPTLIKVVGKEDAKRWFEIHFAKFTLKN